MNRAKNSVHPFQDGQIDTTYMTTQRDVFTSGLAKEIGPHAFLVWLAIKHHADFSSGKCYPGIRRLSSITGMAKQTVQDAIPVLEAAHLLRVTRLGYKNNYVARERLDVRVGKQVVCSLAIDFVPASMRSRLAMLKASDQELEAADVWAVVDLIPGPGLTLQESGVFVGRMRADQVPEATEVSEASPNVCEERLRLLALADSIRKGAKRIVPGK